MTNPAFEELSSNTTSGNTTRREITRRRARDVARLLPLLRPLSLARARKKPPIVRRLVDEKNDCGAQVLAQHEDPLVTMFHLRPLKVAQSSHVSISVDGGRNA